MLGLLLVFITVIGAVHANDELFLHLGFGAAMQIGLLYDVEWEPARLVEMEDPVNRCNLQPMLYVEHDATVLDIHILLLETPCVVPGKLHLLLTEKHTGSRRLSLVRGESLCMRPGIRVDTPSDTRGNSLYIDTIYCTANQSLPIDPRGAT